MSDMSGLSGARRQGTSDMADTPDVERGRALTDLQAGRTNVVFSVDLFNEGVDVPSVDTLLMLRPTESPLLFLSSWPRVEEVCGEIPVHRTRFRRTA